MAARLTMAVLLVSMTGAPIAHATGSEAGSFVVAGAASLPDYPGSDDTQLVPFFVGRFETLGLDTELEGLRLRVNLQSDYGFRAGPMMSLTLPRDDDVVESQVVAAFEPLTLGVELGGFLGFEVPLCGQRRGCSIESSRLSGNLMIRHDVAGAHDGLVVTADTRYFFKLARILRLSVGINMTVTDSDYAQTYFGVADADSARSGLPRFSSGGGIQDIGAELFTIVSFSEQLGLFARLSVNQLMGDAADSPVTEIEGDRQQRFIGLGVFWRL